MCLLRTVNGEKGADGYNKYEKIQRTYTFEYDWCLHLDDD